VRFPESRETGASPAQAAPPEALQPPTAPGHNQPLPGWGVTSLSCTTLTGRRDRRAPQSRVTLVSPVQHQLYNDPTVAYLNAIAYLE